MSDSTKPKIKPVTALAIGGIVIAGASLVLAIVSPGSLDWILRPSDQRSAQIKAEMERQKASDTNAQSKQAEIAAGGAVTPTPSPTIPPLEEPSQAPQAEDGNTREYERIARPGCISLDQVVNIIGESTEAREGRVVGIRVAPDGGRIMVAYRKKTFLGIGSGENQIEGILRRGLRNIFSNRLIESLKVRSTGTKSVRRGADNVKAEVLEIESLQAGCRWP
jgi:hypothetical protein